MADPVKIGPTGEFVNGGPAIPGDKGGVYVKFAVVSQTPPLLGMDFGTALDWTALPIEEALAHAKSFRETVHKAFGPLSYDASTLPLRVTLVRDNRLVRTDFPQTLAVLIANPHLYLAWADKLEEAVAQLVGQS